SPALGGWATISHPSSTVSICYYLRTGVRLRGCGTGVLAPEVRVLAPESECSRLSGESFRTLFGGSRPGRRRRLRDSKSRLLQRRYLWRRRTDQCLRSCRGG